MAEISKEEYEKNAMRDAFIIGIVGLCLLMAAMLYAFKMLLGL